MTKPDHTAALSSPCHAPIAIVGIGCLFPKADSPEAFWTNIAAGVDAIDEIPKSHWKAADYFDADRSSPDMTYANRGGFLEPVDFDPLRFGISPNNIEATDTTQLLGMLVAGRALRDAGYATTEKDDHGRPFDRDRTSVILGVTGTLELVIPLGARLGHPIWRKALADAGVEKPIADDVVRRIADGYVPWQENSFPGLLGNVAAGRIANRFDLGGTNCVVDAACASSLSAIHMAAMELHAGRSDMVVTGGLDTFNDIFMYMCFSKTPALSPTGNSRPFSAAADGTILGEGLGVVILKRLSDARRDGDRIHAVIRAIGTSSDGRGNAVYAPSAAGQTKALRDAYRLANLSPNTIELIEAHGTGTKVGDAVEISALTEVYREARPEGTWCALGSVKSMIGHTKAAAGVAGLIKATLALRHKVLPPTIKVDRPADAVAPGNAPVYVNTEQRPWLPRKEHLRRAGLSAFGFGGSNFHCVLEEAESAKSDVSASGDVQILAFSAASVAVLRDEVNAIDPTLTWSQLRHRAAQSRKTFRSDDRCRLLAVVEKDQYDLTKAIATILHQLQSNGEKTSWNTPDGFAFGIEQPTGRLAAIFPGQGSQYLGMLRDLACQFPEMLDALAQGDQSYPDSPLGQRLSDQIYPIPVFDEHATAQLESALRDTSVAQPALGAVSLGAWQVLQRFGITFDVAAGHSFGELVALFAAGRISQRSMHRLAVERGRLMAAGSGDRGAMLAVAASYADVQALIESEKLDLVIANHNGPQQVVISGASQAVDRASRLFSAKGIAAKRLAVSAAFHSRFVADAQAAFAEILEDVTFTQGQMPIMANRTAKAYPQSSAEAKEMLAGQLALPVLFAPMIKQMIADGVRTFVEVGPDHKLAGLIRAIGRSCDLPAETIQAISLDASRGRRGGEFDLATLLVRIAAAGYPIKLTEWDASFAQGDDPSEPAKPGMTVQICGANYVMPRKPKPASPQAPPQQQPTSEPPRHSVTEPPKRSQSPSHPPKLAELGPKSPIAKPRPTALTTPTPPAHVHQALEATRQSILALQQMQQQTADLHRQYLEGQTAAQQTIASLLDQQQQLFAASSGIALSAPVALPATSSAPTVMSQEVMSQEVTPQEAPPQETSSPASDSSIQTRHHPPASPPPVTASVPTTPAPTAALSTAALSTAAPVTHCESSETSHLVLLEVVAEKTGYPVEMLELDMNLDTDLGIDSIKRVEILSAIQERLPDAPVVNPDDLATLQTLRQVVDFLQQMPATDQSSSTETVATHRSAQEDRASIVLQVVADKTGYGVEMLDLDMDLDSDLGIDSIKRVEILSAVQERLPDVPEVQPDDLAALHSLRQVVAFLDRDEATATTNTPPQEQAPPPPTRIEPTPIEPTPTEPTPLAPAPAEPRSQEKVTGLISEPRSQEKVTGSISEPRSEEKVTGSPLAPPAPADAAIKLCEVGDLICQQVSVRPLDLNASRRRVGISPGGQFWIVDDGSGLAEHLCEALAAVAVTAQVISIAAPPPPDNLVGLLILAPAATDDAFVFDAFALVQRVAPALRGSATGASTIFATVSRLGGAFGLDSDESSNPVSGALAGILKTAAIEWPEVKCKALDVSDDFESAADLAHEIVSELLLDGPIEVGLRSSGRSAVRLTDVMQTETSAATSPFEKGDTFVVSGGARGVTAEVAFALAESFGVNLLLLGRSPEPSDEPEALRGITDEVELKRAIAAASNRPMDPKALQFQYRRITAHREITANLARIKNAGGRVIYRSLDIRDVDAVACAVAEARAHLGPICGMVHGAGVLADRRIEDKTAEQFSDVYTTKVDGLRALLKATESDDLKAIALFSSSTARFGRRGQSDYAAANEVLNKMARVESERRTDCRVASVNWGPWDGGMVNEQLKAMFRAEGVGLIGLEAGAERLVQEISTPACSSVEMVVLGPVPCGDVPSDASSAESLPLSGDSKQTDRPSASHCEATAAMHVTSSRDLATRAYPLLRSHVIGARAVLPMAVIVEWLAHGAMHDHPGLVFTGFDNLRVFKGVTLDADEVKNVQVRTGPSVLDGSSEYVPVELRCGDRLHAGGTIVLATSLPSGERSGDPAAEKTCTRSAAEIYNSGQLFHGPLLEGIISVDACDRQGITAQVNSAGAPATWMNQPMRSSWLADPLVLDASFQMMILWCFDQTGHGSLPTSIARYRQMRRSMPRSGIQVVARITAQREHAAEASIEFLDRDGELVGRIDGYECVIDASLQAAFAQNELAQQVEA